MVSFQVTELSSHWIVYRHSFRPVGSNLTD